MTRIPEFFCNGIERIEMIGGGCVRFTLFENCARTTKAYRRDVVQIIVPLAALPHMIQQATACLLWSEPAEKDCPELPFGVMH